MTIKYKKTNKRSRNTRKQAILWLIGIVAAIVLIGNGVILLQQNQNKVKSVETTQDKSIGNADAPVTVVEYGDYQCPACGRFALSVKPKIVEEFVKTGKVRFVFRSFQFIGQESQWAAEAAECANEQGKYWEYYEKVYSKQAGENAGAFRKENLIRFASELGLQTESFNQCLASGKYTDKVKAETLEAERLGLRSTPSLLVNGKLVEGGAQYEILSQKIREALSKSK